MLEIFKLAVEPLESNCYLAWDTQNNEAVVIDPGGQAEKIIAAIDRRKLNVRYILNTHGHGDHIAANSQVKARYGVPLLIHEADTPMLSDPYLNMSAVYGFPVTSPRQDGFLVPGEKVRATETKAPATARQGAGTVMEGLDRTVDGLGEILKGTGRVVIGIVQFAGGIIIAPFEFIAQECGKKGDKEPGKKSNK